MGLRRRHLLAAAATTAGAMMIDLTPVGPAEAGVRHHATPADPVPVDLAARYDNNGVGVAAGDANIDGSGYGIPSAGWPTGTVTLGGVPYALPTTTAAGQNDNVVATGQTIALPAGTYVTAYLLATATYGAVSGTATVHYSDGSTSAATLSVPDWYSGGSGAVNATTRYTPTGTDAHPVAVYAVPVWLDPTRTATGLTLPTTAHPAPNVSSLHVFALSVQPVASGLAVVVRGAVSTASWLPAGSGRAQIVRATVVNLGTEAVTAAHALRVGVTGSGVGTAVPAKITALATGEEARVEIGITSPGLPAGTPVNGTVTVTGAGLSVAEPVGLTAGIAAYTTTDASLSRHTAPDWFSDAKFGIFIHWGVYSVPAWGPVGKEYAEWYWAQMQNPADPTYDHHRQTYGENFNYDDFIPRFTAAKFDPHAWIDLFTAAGAKYFVLTSKHHEGFALFDTAVSDRNAVKMGPKQDLVGTLFAAAARYAPSMRRGVYYSLPEWFNPVDPWQGHGPRNPYTGADLPYTGAKPITDYVAQLQVPQLKELITQYRPDILWGDIGSPATDRSVLELAFNQALSSGREMTVNNRMGLPSYDFTTPEYASSFSLQTSKFEACRGIDPFSFGYNQATPDDAYATAQELVTQLVDIVSKNGNFLLDIGPRADGTIADIMATRLREMGAWLAVNGEAVYATTYWAKGAADGDLRFTVAPNKAFYLSSLVAPGSQVTVHAPVPVRDGDHVSLLGYGPLHTSRNAAGELVIDVPAAARDSGQYVWVFKATPRA